VTQPLAVIARLDRPGNLEGENTINPDSYGNRSGVSSR
jgi:hypothetical protein